MLKTLVWNGKDGHIERGEIGNILKEKPTVNIEFDELYFEEFQKVKVLNGVESTLSAEEITAINEFITNYQMQEPTLDDIKLGAIESLKQVTNAVLKENYDWKVLKLMELKSLGENVDDELRKIVLKKNEIRDLSNKYENEINNIVSENELKTIFENFEKELKRVVKG